MQAFVVESMMCNVGGDHIIITKSEIKKKGLGLQL